MTFPHDDRDFAGLLRIVSAKRNLSAGLVEKDYWVTHTLWALQHQGFDVWFKGGTSLSKGFGLIQRFSEDLDLEIEPGTVRGLSRVASWKGEGAKACAERHAFFESLARILEIPGATTKIEHEAADPAWRSADLRVLYPGRHLADLGVFRPFVLLEVGSARVTPAVARDLSSFVHDELDGLGQLGGFADNRPRALRCVHPLVTLLEKLDALARRVARPEVDPATFVRHFEDAARIIQAEDAAAGPGRLCRCERAL